MGGYIIFGSHNKQLAPFFLFEVGGKWGGGVEGGTRNRRDREGEAARAMLFYGSCHMDEGAARP